MLQAFSVALSTIAIAASFSAGLYVCFVFVGIHRFRQRRRVEPVAGTMPAVTILKPVCGADFELYENLRSFCEQDYPICQLVFVTRSRADPAVQIVDRLIEAFPDRDIALVVNPEVHGANLKVSNLVNAASAAKYEILVISDSDMRVGSNYLSTVVRPFGDGGVGVVTCLYRGVSAGNHLSDLACLQINEWFLPSVLVSGLLQGDCHCFGATMAVRRDILARAGGFESLADVLADDHMIGTYALEQGYRVELSPYVVDNYVEERTLRALFAHELRWARTIRILNPAGHGFSFLINTISVAAIGLAIAGLTGELNPVSDAFLALAVILRLVLHRVVTKALDVTRPAPYWMVPLRDLTSFAVWAASFLSRDVRWRGERFNAGRHGRMVNLGKPEMT